MAGKMLHNGSDYNQQPGMNDAQRKADSQTFSVPVEMLTRGKFMKPEDMSGPDVGSPYDGDIMGESRTMITYRGKSKK